MNISTSLRNIAGDFLTGRALRHALAEFDEETPATPHPDDTLGLMEAEMERAEREETRKALAKHGLSLGEDDRVVTLSMVTAAREMLYDLVDCSEHDPEEALSHLGLPTPSREVVEMTRRASDQRMAAVEGLDDIIHRLSTTLQTAVTAWDDEPLDDPEELEEEAEFLAHGSMVIVAQLIQLGLLEKAAELQGVVEHEIEGLHE